MERCLRSSLRTHRISSIEQTLLSNRNRPFFWVVKWQNGMAGSQIDCKRDGWRIHTWSGGNWEGLSSVTRARIHTRHGSNRQYDVRTAVVDNVGVQRLPTILKYGQEKTLERCRFRCCCHFILFPSQLFSQQSGNQHLTYENTDCVAQEHVRSGCGAGCCSPTQSPQKQYMHYCQGKL